MALLLEVQQNTECFLEALSSVLSFEGYDGALLVDHACTPVLDESREPAGFWAFEYSHVFAAIRRWTGAAVSLATFPSWEPFIESIECDLRARHPVIVLADTFFLFPKKKEHENHVVIVNRVDEGMREIGFLSSGGPGKTFSYGQFRVAAVSNRIEGRASYQRIRLDLGDMRPVISIGEAIRAHRAALVTSQNRFYGSDAIRKASPRIARELESEVVGGSDPSEAWFRRLRPFEHQKRRLHRLLERHASESVAATTAFRRIINHWEVARSLCLKRSMAGSVPVSSITSRLERIADIERQAELLLESSLS